MIGFRGRGSESFVYILGCAMKQFFFGSRVDIIRSTHVVVRANCDACRLKRGLKSYVNVLAMHAWHALLCIL